ncbi:MAG TPA: AI-2E family transporter [Terracidiphilus sp.]|jgi:predicted PurR-regulated permease PerM|nr:AI-2E family transporter [Terracidiphilus sp.]
MNETTRAQRSRRSDIIFVFVLAFACYLVWLMRTVLVLLYVSALFAVVFAPVVQAVGRLRIGRWQPFKGIALLVLPLSAFGLLIVFGFTALPPVIRDLQEFAKEMPSKAPGLIEKVRHLPFADQIDIDDINTKLQNFASNAATYLLVSIKDWAGKLFDVIMGFILTVYFILEGDHAYRWFLSFFSSGNRERLDATLQRAEVRMGKWLLGQGSLMLILGVTSTIVYLSLHVRYAYALGALTGMLNMIPVIGAAVCIALALLVSAIDSWGRVLGVGIFYLVYLQLENSFLVPRIMKSRVGLPGLAILVALLIGSALAGVIGAMVAVPTAVLVSELVDEYLVNKNGAKA